MAASVNTSEIIVTARDLQENLLQCMLGMVDAAEKSSRITGPNSQMQEAVKQLQNPDFNIVVCGEVKRGKSTLINALIGREILPTGVAETTSQVFRITYADDEHCFLYFDDASRQEISFDELKRYGSQTDADLHGEPMFDDKRLMHIQVNLPLEFLPRGVTIVDTPGLGALYKSHQEITHSYISQADAVIFVLDTNQPLVKQEKEFLQNFVFPKTPYVLFVMTKIDCVEETVCIDLLRRNEALLKEAFEEQCYTLPKVYPVASTLLFEAANEEDADERNWLLDDSLFPQAKEEITNLITQTVGLYRNTMAYNLSLELFKTSFNAIKEQLTFLAASSKEEQQKFRRRKQDITIEFEQQWGANSTQRRDIITRINEILNAVRMNVMQLLSPAGEVYVHYSDAIDGLNQADVEAFAQQFGPAVLDDLARRWSEIIASGEAQIAQQLAQMGGSLQELSNRQLIQQNDAAINTPSISPITHSEYFMGFRSQFMNASITTSATITIAGILGVLGPAGWVTLTLGGILYGILGGRSDARRKHLEKNKIELKRGLQEIFLQAKKQMVEVSVLDGKHASRLDAYIKEMQLACTDAMETMYAEAKQHFDAENQILEELYNQGLDAAKLEIDEVNKERGIWTRFGTQLSELHDALIELNDALNK